MMKKNSCGSKIPHPPHNFSNGLSLMGKHVFTFTTISNDVQQMDQKTNVMATNGARASFFFSFLTTTTVTQVTGKSERIPVF